MKPFGWTASWPVRHRCPTQTPRPAEASWALPAVNWFIGPVRIHDPKSAPAGGEHSPPSSQMPSRSKHFLDAAFFPGLATFGTLAVRGVRSASAQSAAGPIDRLNGSSLAAMNAGWTTRSGSASTWSPRPSAHSTLMLGGNATSKSRHNGGAPVSTRSQIDPVAEEMPGGRHRPLYNHSVTKLCRAV
jgi:hypothetical protein